MLQLLERSVLFLCCAGILLLIIYHSTKDKAPMEIYVPNNVLFIDLDNLRVTSQDKSINVEFDSYNQLNEFVTDITYELNEAVSE